MNLFINSRTLGEVTRVFYVKDHVLWEQGYFDFLLPFCIPCILFSCRIALVKLVSGILNRSGHCGYLCLFPDFKGSTFNFLSFTLTLGVSLS